MPSNLDRYKTDLDKLIVLGDDLTRAMYRDCNPADYERQMGERYGVDEKEKLKKHLGSLPDFKSTYQAWYSESKSLIELMLPNRLADFVSYYEVPKGRKSATYDTYRIVDYLNTLSVTHGHLKIVGPTAALPRMAQQVAILKAVKGRFESSLYDIKQLLQGDVFDSELDAAKELSKKKFTRAAGAIAGVVLERHLSQVRIKHQIAFAKKEPTISELNDALLKHNVIDQPAWRFIQRLMDIRNLCDHSKDSDPTPEQVDELIAGTDKIIKTVA
ncbi:MAG TPA: hypothetical protein VK525_15045 [Candidatus Saccharimonadales bacterium]|nr:hypothetical protein [Candidatus Saccharimonadales bacterium]